MDISENGLLKEARSLAGAILRDSPGTTRIARLKVSHDRAYGYYVDMAKRQDGGYLELWSAHEAEHGDDLLWVGLFYDNKAALYSALSRSSVDVPTDHVLVFESDGVTKSRSGSLYDTAIELYEYASEYYVGRYFAEYSLQEASSYVQLLLGGDRRYTIETIPMEIGSAIDEAGQWGGLTAKQRRAVELRAMKVSKDWLRKEDYEAEDMSSRKSYDFLALKDGEEWIVEVKGTTGDASAILLTKNEVAEHRARYPLNML